MLAGRQKLSLLDETTIASDGSKDCPLGHIPGGALIRHPVCSIQYRRVGEEMGGGASGSLRVLLSCLKTLPPPAARIKVAPDEIRFPSTPTVQEQSLG